jgi:hypothetical protein
MEDLSKAKEFILKLLMANGLCVDGVLSPKYGWWVMLQVLFLLDAGVNCRVKRKKEKKKKRGFFKE